VVALSRGHQDRTRVYFAPKLVLVNAQTIAPRFLGAGRCVPNMPVKMTVYNTVWDSPDALLAHVLRTALRCVFHWLKHKIANTQLSSCKSFPIQNKKGTDASVLGMNLYGLRRHAAVGVCVQAYLFGHKNLPPCRAHGIPSAVSCSCCNKYSCCKRRWQDKLSVTAVIADVW
jgi:hypothetical protein